MKLLSSLILPGLVFVASRPGAAWDMVEDIYFHNPGGMFKRYNSDNMYQGKYCNNSAVDNLAPQTPPGIGPCFGDWPVQPQWQYTEDTMGGTRLKAQGTVYGTYACHDWLQCWNDKPNGVGLPSHPFVVAMPIKYTGQPGDSSFRHTPADRCFQCVAVEVVDQDGSARRAVLQVTDTCPECNDAHIDMSTFALQYLNDPSLANPGGPTSPQKFRWGWYDCGHDLGRRQSGGIPQPSSSSSLPSSSTATATATTTPTPTATNTATATATTTITTSGSGNTGTNPDFASMKLGPMVISEPLTRLGNLMMSGALSSNRLLGCGYQNIDDSAKPWLIGTSAPDACGKCIAVQANGMTIKGIVVETAGGGNVDSIMLPPDTMSAMSPNTGYVPNVSWGFVSCQ